MIVGGLHTAPVCNDLHTPDAKTEVALCSDREMREAYHCHMATRVDLLGLLGIVVGMKNCSCNSSIGRLAVGSFVGNCPRDKDVFLLQQHVLEFLGLVVWVDL